MHTFRKSARATFVGVLVAASLLGAPGALATPGLPGSCAYGVIENANGTVDVTNSADFMVGQDFYEVGCVTVTGAPGVSMYFKDAITYPGWTYRVKEAGGTGKKRRVSVEFSNPAVIYKVTFVMQPDRLDWKVS